MEIELSDKSICEGLARLLLLKFKATGNTVCTSLIDTGQEFDPINNKGTNLVIRDDFETVVDYIAREVSIYGDLNGEWTALATTSYNTKYDIGRAVCLVVLEVHGK